MHQNVEKEYGYSITHWFQPIYHLKDNDIIGYEALLRNVSEAQASPVEIFREADKNGYLNLLDRVSIKTAADSFEDRQHRLFLNVFSSTLLDESFLSWWDSNIANPGSIVLELLESEPVGNWEALKKVTRKLQSKGVKIAIDDMGAGYSFFQQWIELTPDFIKLDKYFADNLAASAQKQETVKSLVGLLSDTTEIIIEGIETEEDMNTAGSLGIPYAQGYLLGKPRPRNSRK
jgi:EAL domain-containing protein (putative c-di-GMP-specific phosphodiesterase class I)